MIDSFWLGMAAILVALCVIIGGAIYLCGNYDYHWKAACAAANGVVMENTSSQRVCLQGEVRIVTIAVRPW